MSVIQRIKELRDALDGYIPYPDVNLSTHEFIAKLVESEPSREKSADVPWKLIELLPQLIQEHEALLRFVKAVKKARYEDFEHEEGVHWIDYDTDKVNTALRALDKELNK